MRAQSAADSDISKRSKMQNLSRVSPNRPGGRIVFPGIPVNFSRNAEIYGESEPADYFYKVVSGTVRTSKVRIDGRRQIGGFDLPGEKIPGRDRRRTCPFRRSTHGLPDAVHQPPPGNGPSGARSRGGARIMEADRTRA